MEAACIEHIHNLMSPPIFDDLGTWVFLRNAKTATTSIGTGPLRHKFSEPRPSWRNYAKHIGRYTRVTPSELRRWERTWEQVVKLRIDEALLFTFVRNPWDRVLSAFLMCQRTGKPIHRIDSTWEFKSYVKEVLAVKGTDVNYHFVPQYDTVCFDGKLIPRLFVGRFERLQEDWSEVAKRIGVSSKLPRKNASPVKIDYREHYDDETRDIIGRLYQPEIEFLGYTFA